jgi:hypothetical protein
VTPFTDDQLRARFRALGASEKAGAPDFRALVDRAHSSAAGHRPLRRRPVARAALMLATAAAIVVAALLARTGRNRSPAPSLTDWSSPTAVLLNTPAVELLQPPDLLSSVLDRMMSTTVQPKGD